MLKVGYDNGNEIDMYVEHFDYDIMEMAEFEKNEEQNENIIDSSDDDNYSSDDCQEIENLCSSRILFRGLKGVVYPAFDPDIPWDKMEPMLGTRRAKLLALFDHEGGLLEHYEKLYKYRMYICFKGVKDGWLAGCRKGLLDVMLPEIDRRCAAFENDIPESFNRAILGPRHNSIITMLEKIREWIVFPSGFQELEVRKVIRVMTGGGSSSQGDGSGGSGSGMGGSGGIGDGSGGSGSGMGSSGGIGDGSGRTNSKGGGRGRRGGGMPGRGGGRGSRGGGSRRGGGMVGSSSRGAKTITLDGVLTDEETEESLEEVPYNQQYHKILISHIHSQPTQHLGVWVVDTTVTTANIEEAPAVETSDTTEVGEEAQAVETSDTIDKGNASASVDKGKAPITVEDEPVPKRKRGRPPSHVDAIRIYHKNHGRSKRIANMKLKYTFSI
ncbi:hypothetical protein Tco_1175180 [Tanacetum coccineum]